jgi:hypothetical protein
MSQRAAQYLQVASLPEALGTAQAVRVVFRFTGEDGQGFTIGDDPNGSPADLPVAAPGSPLPRQSAS